MEITLTVIKWFLLGSGSFLLLVGAIGVLRFPDVFTRIHAASITDTLGVTLILGGLMVQAGFTLISIKLAFILVFLYFTSPTSSHALAKAAIHGGVPLTTDFKTKNEN